MKTTTKENFVFISISGFAIILAVIAILMPLVLMQSCDNNEILKKNQEKKDLFLNQNKTFICAESIMKYSKSWIVSEENNWSIHGEYFKKDTLLLSIANCKIDNIASE